MKNYCFRQKSFKQASICALYNKLEHNQGKCYDMLFQSTLYNRLEYSKGKYYNMLFQSTLYNRLEYSKGKCYNMLFQKFNFTAVDLLVNPITLEIRF